MKFYLPESQQNTELEVCELQYGVANNFCIAAICFGGPISAIPTNEQLLGGKKKQRFRSIFQKLRN